MNPQSYRLTGAINLFLILCIGGISLLRLAGMAPAKDATREPAKSALLGEQEFSACDAGSYLRGEIFGVVERTLNWHGAEMLCDGMPRPANGGFRLMFSEFADQPDQGLRLVIGAIDAELGTTQGEHVANVTLIDQDRAQFFSTQGLERCWIKLSKQSQGKQQTSNWHIAGELYCVGALAAVDGSGSITLSDIEFAGRLSTFED